MAIKDVFNLLKRNGPNLVRLLQAVEHGVTGTNFSGALVPAAPSNDMLRLRDDISGVSRSYTNLLRQMQDQTVQIAGVEEEVKRLRMAVEHSERRVEGVERELASVTLWVKALGGIMIALLLVAIGVMILVLRARAA